MAAFVTVPLSEYHRRNRRKPALHRRLRGEIVRQRGAEKARGDQRSIDAPQPGKRGIAQAAGDGIADDQRAGDHRRGQRHAERHHHPGAPVIARGFAASTGAGSLRASRSGACGIFHGIQHPLAQLQAAVETRRQLQVMRHHHHHYSLPRQLQEEGDDIGAAVAIKVAGRLIAEQQLSPR